MLAVLFMNRMNMRKRAANKQLAKNVANTLEKAETEYCRTCLSTEELVSIFYNKESEDKRANDLLLVTGLEIKMNDGLSQKICPSCIEIINTALRFRRTSRKAEKALKNMLNGIKSKKKAAKLQKAVKLPKQAKAKVEKVEYDDYTYDDALYTEDFQHDYDNYLVKEEDCKPKPKQKQLPGRKKRTVLPNAPSYKCTTCNKEFRMKATYKAHMRFHSNYCICESCGKRCRNNNQLQEHKRALHGLGRIHKCTYCEYSSATKEALTIHERRHTGERPYICDHCGATFHRRSNLVQHMPIHLPEKNFQCDMCPKKLKSRKFLQIHKHNAHTGRRYGYLCPICKHRFEKPNKCPTCPKRLQSRKLLAIHEYKYHRENKYRYICPICQDSFTRPGNVRQHLARSHRVPREHQGVIHKLEDFFTRPGNVRQHLARSHRVPREHQGVIHKLEITLPSIPKEFQSMALQYIQ